jgi:hypothetical protein
MMNKRQSDPSTNARASSWAVPLQLLRLTRSTSHEQVRTPNPSQSDRIRVPVAHFRVFRGCKHLHQTLPASTIRLTHYQSAFRNPVIESPTCDPKIQPSPSQSNSVQHAFFTFFVSRALTRPVQMFPTVFARWRTREHVRTPAAGRGCLMTASPTVRLPLI